jgi:serine/threonine protein kinase
LGDGSYGKVKECLDMNSLARRAVKIINLKTVARKIPRGVENVRKEISIMKQLNHKNVIKLYDTFEKGNLANTSNKKSPSNGGVKEAEKNGGGAGDELLVQSAAMVNLEKPPKIYIFMDYCMTNLEKLLKNAPDQRLRNWQANFYFKQLIDGLEYLHSLNIIHNDIKPGNLLITCDDVLKLCDFSISAKLNIFCEEDHRQLLSKRNDNLDDDQEVNYNERDGINPNLLSNSSSHRFPIIQCTPMFQCPEMLDEDIDELLILKNATKVDVWSSGITLYQLTTGNF